jgi:hypothetical protein
MGQAVPVSSFPAGLGKPSEAKSLFFVTFCLKMERRPLNP